MTDPNSFQLGIDRLTAHKLVALAETPNPRVTASKEVREHLRSFRQIVEKAGESDKRFYGINTGFGYLSNTNIERSKLFVLQENIIRSHACGVGAPVAPEVCRALMILRLHTFLLGHTGISEACIDQMLAFLRHDILPIIPCQGSVGASGDLAPLAHLALGLVGEGDVVFRGERLSATLALKEANLKPFRPHMKEGLSLINGTQFMTAVGTFALCAAKELACAADGICALSLDAVRGTDAAFDARVHQARPQVGQGQVAENLRRLFRVRDPIKESHADCDKVQDPYSFRCAPQVHGACRDTLRHVESVLTIELNSVTDNPLVFEDGAIISGGNFHGEPVAMVMDFLAIAMSELGNIAERRIEKMINPNLSGLPPFLMKESGLNSGYMIPHVVAAALASENKVLCHPACVDSIPTSADKEDHVSMGPIAARKAREVNGNVARILAIEALAAAQGIDLLAPLKPSKPLAAIHQEIRKLSPFMEKDRSLQEDIEKVAQWILQGGVSATLNRQGITLE